VGLLDGHSSDNGTVLMPGEAQELTFVATGADTKPKEKQLATTVEDLKREVVVRTPWSAAKAGK